MRRLFLLLLLLVHLPCWAGGYCLSYCKPGPLHCGAWSIAARSGVAPSLYAKREEIWWTIPPQTVSPGLLERFSHQFQLPWEIDGEVALNLSIRVQGFLQYQFQQGGGRKQPEASWSRYQTHAGYLGARYFYNGYCSSCFGRLTPFIGFKGGLMWRRPITEQIGDREFTYSSSYVAVSAGLQAGIEWFMTWYWTLIFQIDGVATQGLKSNQNATFNPALPNGVTNINIPSGGAVLSFPITAGMRFTF